MSSSLTRDRIIDFLAPRLGDTELADDDDIFELGYVNSLFAMQLLRFIEQEFALELGPEDLDFDNFRSVGSMLRLIDRKTVPAM